MTAAKILAALEAGGYDAGFARLYGADRIADQRKRWSALVAEQRKHFGDGEVRLFSAPGRTELGGNHTDHNHGLALAGAIQLDCAAAVTPTDDGRIRLHDLVYGQDYSVAVADTAKSAEEAATTTALVRGIDRWFADHGLKTGAYRASLHSTVFAGSGLSSSASVEVLLGSVQNGLYNGGAVDPVRLAIAGRYAENEYFGKPSGLLDQLTSASGGVIAIDFAEAAEPKVDRLDYDFSAEGWKLCIVDARCHHAGGTSDYAAIFKDMKDVSAAFGAAWLRQVDEAKFWAGLGALRPRLAARALLRAAHFFEENRRVLAMAAALRAGDLAAYLSLVAASGDSSFKYLQNIVGADGDQSYALALLLADQAGRRWGVVSRVHGGGFGGTIQAYVPEAAWTDFTAFMEAGLGSGCVTPLRIRPAGPVELYPL